jgi:hypothetical protein
VLVDGPSRPRPRWTRSPLDRAVERIMKLFGSSQPRQSAASQQPRPGAAMPQRTPDPQSNFELERMLARFETMPGEMAELKRSLGEILHRFDLALDHLGIEAKRLSNESSALALMADKLQMRLEQLHRALNGDYHEAPRERAVAPEPPVPTEPQFRPSDQGINVVIGNVPGFQGLMDVQRALESLPEVEKASVLNFRNDEASLQLVLRNPITARQLVDALAQATGAELLIEESRPEAQRLRLRFVEGEGRR